MNGADNGESLQLGRRCKFELNNRNECRNEI